MGVDTGRLNKQPVIEALRALPSGWHRMVALDDVLLSMPTVAPRTFSIASIPDSFRTPQSGWKAWSLTIELWRNPVHGLSPTRSRSKDSSTGCQKLELLAQKKSGGKFSEVFLNSARPGDCLRCKVQPATKLRSLCSKEARSILAFITGSGFAPMQSLLRLRAQQIRQDEASGAESPFRNQISLFVGFHKGDSEIIHEGIVEAVTSGVLDLLCLTPSNQFKARVQDKVFQPGICEHIEAKIRDGAYVFVCTNEAAAGDVAVNLNAVLGCDDVRTALEGKYIQDTFSPISQ